MVNHRSKNGLTISIDKYIASLDVDKNNKIFIDHKTIQTTDQTIIIITIDQVTIPRTEILMIQIDREIVLSHHTGIVHNIKKKL